MTARSIGSSPRGTAPGEYGIAFPRGCKDGAPRRTRRVPPETASRQRGASGRSEAQFGSQEEVDPRGGVLFPFLVVAVQQVQDLPRQGDLRCFSGPGRPEVPAVKVDPGGSPPPLVSALGGRVP